MANRIWTRTQQMWVIIVLCISIFSAAIAFIPEVTWPAYWKIMAAALFSCALCIVLFELWLRRVLGRRDEAINFVNRVATGDLSISASEIVAATRSQRMASALRALVSNLERTIRPFGQRAADVGAVSQQTGGRARLP